HFGRDREAIIDTHFSHEHLGHFAQGLGRTKSTTPAGMAKSHAEMHPEVVALVQQLRYRQRNGERRSLREISAELARRGYLNVNGVPYAPKSIAAMLRQQPTPRAAN